MILFIFQNRLRDVRKSPQVLRRQEAELGTFNYTNDRKFHRQDKLSQV